jgi:hypothetical protein
MKKTFLIIALLTIVCSTAHAGEKEIKVRTLPETELMACAHEGGQADEVLVLTGRYIIKIIAYGGIDMYPESVKFSDQNGNRISVDRPVIIRRICGNSGPVVWEEERLNDCIFTR